jgi:transcriptional regulator with XRE-family HTH domain
MLTCINLSFNKQLALRVYVSSIGGVVAFPENLRRIRLGQFLSQAELARRSGVHTLTITRLETGRTAPSTRTVRALAHALRISPSELATPEEVAEADRGHRQGAARQATD